MSPLTISINITVHGTNKKSFTGLKSILEQAIADAIPVPVASVSSLFVDMAPPIPSRSNDNMVVINSKIHPTDTDQETIVLEKINIDQESLLLDINVKLDTHNTQLLTIGEVERVTGNVHPEIIFPFLHPIKYTCN